MIKQLEEAVDWTDKGVFCEVMTGRLSSDNEGWRENRALMRVRDEWASTNDEGYAPQEPRMRQ